MCVRLPGWYVTFLRMQYVKFGTNVIRNGELTRTSFVVIKLEISLCQQQNLVCQDIYKMAAPQQSDC